jgi:hypothetical protein
MDNTEHGEMHIDGYSFMGMHWFWWGSILIFTLVLSVAPIVEEEENNLIKKKKLWNIISVKLTTVSKMQ